MDDAVGWFGALGMCLATVISYTTWKSIAWHFRIDVFTLQSCTESSKC